MAEYYSRNLAREVMKGMKETALQCKHTGGKPPLGYDVASDKTYIINEQETQIVRTFFEMYAAGKGYSEIINQEGHKTQTGRPFGKNSIHYILKNEKYKGVYIFNRTERKINGKRNHHKSKNKNALYDLRKKIIVYDDKVDIDTIVTFVGGGEGNRTPVRRCFGESVSERSQCFAIPSTGLPLTGSRCR